MSGWVRTSAASGRRFAAWRSSDVDDFIFGIPLFGRGSIQIVHTKHELVQLAASYRRQDRAALQRRRPAGIETRFVIGLLLIKHTSRYPMRRRVNVGFYDPYFQYSATGRSDASLSSGDPASWPIELQVRFRLVTRTGGG